MSDQETITGKVQEDLFAKGLSLEDKIQVLIANEGLSPDDVDDGDYIEDENWVIVGKDRIFRVLEKTDINSSFMCEGQRNEDDTISFQMSFYNGGTCFAEMMYDLIEKVDAND